MHRRRFIIEGCACVSRGYWIDISNLERVGNDTDDDFNWMENIDLNGKPINTEILEEILNNRNGVIMIRTLKIAMRTNGDKIYGLGQRFKENIMICPIRKHLKLNMLLF